MPSVATGASVANHDLSYIGVSGDGASEQTAQRVINAENLEKQRVSGAIRTDFILSAEIMAIALSQVDTPDVITRGIVLAIVALGVTIAVYGAVAIIVD